MSSDRAAGDRLCADYLSACAAAMRFVHDTQSEALAGAARRMAAAIAEDRLIHVYGPGGHANLAAQEIFYRAGGLMHISPILDAGTLLSSGALRSTAMERLPGYGRLVIEQAGLAKGDVLLLINSFGVNAAVIDAALAACARGLFVVGLSGRAAAQAIPADHPARHPSGANLHDLVDLAIDTGVPDGDATLRLADLDSPLGPVSTYANAFALQALVLRTTALLTAQGVVPPIWRSRNAAAGDNNAADLVAAMQSRVPYL